MSPEKDASNNPHDDNGHDSNGVVGNDRDAQAHGSQQGGVNDGFAQAGISEAGVADEQTSSDDEHVGSAPSDVFGNGDSVVGDNGSGLDMGSVVADLGDAGAGVGTDDSVESLQKRLAIAEDQAAAHWDRLLRLQADVENQRKRAQRELVNARKFALEGMVGDLLPIRDSLEMGIAAAQADGGSIEKLLEGTDLTLKMLAQAFEKHSIVEVNPLDEKFNPDFHEAMSMQEVEGKATNTVTAVLQKGYTLNERLIRPALVMVAR